METLKAIWNFFFGKKCKHKNSEITYTDYQDRYHVCNCKDCGTEVWEDL